ncbi:MAG: hypothetical protein ACRDOH_04920 [Streptosporangiaceae bacterium]
MPSTGRAVISSPPASVPWPGSVTHSAGMTLPSAIGGNQAARCSSEP